MKINYGKISRLLLMCLVILLLLMVTAHANESVSLKFNSHELQADVYVKEGVSYISAQSLMKIPGIEVEEEGYIPLRKFFETGAGIVHWDHGKKQVIVSWREKKDGWLADELVMESSQIMQELNTYKMKGNATIKMAVYGSDQDSPNIPEVTTCIEGVFQQQPLTMYVKQSVELPLNVPETELSEEELALFQQGEMTTEMVWKDNAIYQKTPLLDQWIVQDLADMGMMENLTNMVQVNPQQSLEMMRKFGIIYVFGEDVVIDGKDYYTVKNYVDSKTFKKIFEEYMGNFNLAGLIKDSQAVPEQDEEGMEASMNETQQVLEQLLATMELNYYIDTFINKETLLTEGMLFDMGMKYVVNESINPEGPLKFDMKLKGDLQLYDFGTEIHLPDVSDAITQEEYLEKLMNQMEEITEENPAE
ncbi:MAG: hypothetical protein ACOX4H_04835 [Bacillota bacterium]|jgi:hypothetical protein|nr:hypothetical protein [Clostridia bacterium]